MNPVSALGSAAPVLRPDPVLRPEVLPAANPAAGPAGAGFGALLDQLVETVATKEAAAGELTRRVLLGDSGQLHQSVIAMQEASVAFGLMVEVRNKLVESYQELMRLQV